MREDDKTCDNCIMFSGWNDNGRGQCRALPKKICPTPFFGGPGLVPYIITPTEQVFINDCPSFREGTSTGHKNYVMRQEIDRLIESKTPVIIHHNDETGEWLWSVACASDPEFWLDSFETEKHALEYCKKNRIPIVEIACK